jgi:tetratricopeptide (TPR) repeat protein
MVLQAWEQWQSAAMAYDRARTLAPDNAEWPYLAAVVALRTGRVADAVMLLERALLVSKSANLPIRMKLAEALVNAGDLTRGTEAYARLVKEPAAQPEAEYGLGRIAALKGDWKAAIAHQQRACELFPEFGAAHYALGLAYRNAGRLDDAQRELELHRRYGPRWPAIDDPVLAKVNALKDDARANLERGIRLGNEGKLAEAIAAHDAALAKDPDNAQAHANLISLYGRLGQWAEAEKQFKAVLALKSNLDEAYYNYGVVLTLQKRDTEAADAFRRAIDANPLHAQAYNNLGVLLERERRWEDAAGAYRQAIEHQPAFRLGRFNLARMLIALGRNDDAVAELEKLIALAGDDQESPRYVYALSTAHLRAGRVERALAYAQDARRLALAYDQAALVAAIDKDLAALAAAQRQRQP